MFKTINKSKNVLIYTYIHDYHTYEPFTCYLLLKTDKCSFIIDMLKDRRIITRVNFECGIKNYMNSSTFYFLKNEFKIVPCCYKLIKIVQKYLVDYRIRPIDDDFFEILIMGEDDEEMEIESFEEIVNRIFNEHVILYHGNYGSRDGLNVKCANKSIESSKNDTKESLSESYCKNEDKKYVNDEISNRKIVLSMILKIRDFLAKNNNESVDYIVTENQLHILLKYAPKTKMEFKMLLLRCAPLLRAHVEDIIFIINKNEERIYKLDEDKIDKKNNKQNEFIETLNDKKNVMN